MVHGMKTNINLHKKDSVMKKIVYFAVFAALALVSCQEKNAPINNEQKTDAFTFKASIEQPTSNGNTGGAASSSGIAKATINESNQLVWSEGDKIGIYFPDWGEKYQSFTLSSGAGTTSGEFTREQSGEYSSADASIAFFPYDGAGGGDNNISDGVWYYKLKDWYDGYTVSGKMLTPLIAKISSSNEVSFKHAGAAVKLTINNLVSGSYTAKMSVAGKQITGYYHVTAANAGTDALVLNNAEDASKNTITLNTWKGSGAFSWIFPVPELTTPKLTFQIIDDNGITVWSRSPKAQSSLSRADLLVMPAENVTAYEKFVQDNDEWEFHGTIGDGSGSSWHDVPMMTDGNYCVLSGFTFVAGDQFKIHNKKTGAWFPDNNWAFTSENNGAKDIIFNCSTHTITVVNHKFPYPQVALPITINGDMSDWNLIPGSTNETNNYRVFKATYDANNIYLYTKRVNVDGQSYMYYDFDLDNDPLTGTNEGSRTGLEAYMALNIYNSTTSINENPTADPKYPSGSNIESGIVCRGTIGDTFTETELSIPRSNLSISKGDVIKIYSWGNKSADGVASKPITLTILQ